LISQDGENYPIILARYSPNISLDIGSNRIATVSNHHSAGGMISNISFTTNQQDTHSINLDWEWPESRQSYAIVKKNDPVQLKDEYIFAVDASATVFTAGSSNAVVTVAPVLPVATTSAATPLENQTNVELVDNKVRKEE